MVNRNTILSHVLSLWALAAAVRVVYLLLALRHLGADGLVAFLPDTRVYLAMAEHILTGQNATGQEFLFWIGPGYGLILAGIRSVFGSNDLFFNWFNVLLGSLAPVIIYLLGYHLTDSKVVAFTAGLIAALSSTSLSVSCNILTDQPYYIFHASALLCFTVGLKRMRLTWFIAAGLLAGYAAYIRALGQLWPLVYLLIPLVLLRGDALFDDRGFSRWRIFKKTAVTAGLAAVMIFGWAVRNGAAERVFVFGGNGAVAARWYVASRAIADNTSDSNIFEVRERFIEEDNAFFKNQKPSTADKYHRWKNQFLRVALTHPQWVAESIWRNVVDNVRGGNYIAKGQIPTLSWLWWWLIGANDNWLSYLIIGLSVLGLGMLLKERRYFSALLLGFTFAYFTLIIGFSAWQGSRLHYPAEIAWSILVPFAAIRTVRLIVRFWIQRRALLNLAVKKTRSSGGNTTDTNGDFNNVR